RTETAEIAIALVIGEDKNEVGLCPGADGWEKAGEEKEQTEEFHRHYQTPGGGVFLHGVAARMPQGRAWMDEIFDRMGARGSFRI
ncbi:MAG: hypothetical protein MUF86_08395, partial [Akkermansiaceae bacterium]|nr:hypothetical protein [Akkermansiaceae bacterium]